MLTAFSPEPTKNLQSSQTKDENDGKNTSSTANVQPTQLVKEEIDGRKSNNTESVQSNQIAKDEGDGKKSNNTSKNIFITSLLE